MGFLGGSIRIGRLFGVDVRIHSLFLFWMIFEVIRAGNEWWETLWLFGAVFFVVLCHEIGHCFGARWVGGRAHEIILWPLGGLAYAEAPMRPWPQFVTVACGPLVNLLFCILSFGVLAGYMALNVADLIQAGPDAAEDGLLLPGWANAVLMFLLINLFLLVLNLLPIYPLDGGQLFQTILWPIIGFRRATLVSAQVGVIGSLLLGVVGVTFLGDFLFLFIAAFGAMASWRLYRAVQNGEVQPDPAPPAPRRAPVPSAPPTRPTPIRVADAEPGSMPPDSVTPPEDPQAEVKRILRKAAEHGVGSLSYIERQKLERMTRSRPEDGGAPECPTDG